MDIAHDRFNANSADLFCRALIFVEIDCFTCRYILLMLTCGCLFSFSNVSFLVLECRTLSMPDFYCKRYCISLLFCFVFCLNIATICPYAIFRILFLFLPFLLNSCKDHYRCAGEVQGAHCCPYCLFMFCQ